MAVVVSPNSFIRKNEIIKEALRKILTGINIHVKDNKLPDIFLFSSRRSGSTWLMEVIAYESRLRFINEPLGIKYVLDSKLNENNQLEGSFIGEKLFKIPSVNSLENYLNDPRYTRICSAYNVMNGNYHFITNRRLFKIIHANPVLDKIIDMYKENPRIFLIRHPVSNILSLKDAYPVMIDPFLESQPFAEKLDDALIRFIETTLEHGNIFEKWALEWSLDQFVPFQLMKEGKLNVVSYEQFVTEPSNVVKYLGDKFELLDVGRILNNINVPSASTSINKMKFISSSSPDQKIASWRNKIDKSEVIKIFNVIERFNIDYYTADGNYPNEKYMI
jgi:hypothetical protein